jgi:glycosyltransferase involved in cell wall biosynthesis
MTRESPVDVLLVGDIASPHVRRLATELADRAISTAVAGFDGPILEGVRVLRLGETRSTSDLRYLLALPRLHKLIRRVKPRIIHAHYVSSYGLMAAITTPRRSRENACRLVQSAWGSDLLVTARRSQLQRAMARFALSRASFVTVDSDDLRDEANRLAPRTPIQTFVWGPPESLLRQPHNPARLVVSTRRLDPDTRIDLVIAGFRHARAMDRAAMEGWRLAIAGTGSLANALKAEAGGADEIEFVGHLGPSDLHELVSRSALAISIPKSDGTSAALLEALALGVTPIVNDLPANRQWLDSTIAEIVSRDPTAGELGAAILRAVCRPHDEQRIRARVATVTWEREVDRLIDHYDLAGPRASVTADGPEQHLGGAPYES